MTTIPQDLAFSFRALARRPAFALLAILTVGLGIGMNTAMFSIANGVLWKPMPYQDPDQLVMFSESLPSSGLNCSYPNAQDWKRRSPLLEDVALAREFPPATLRLEGSTELVPTGYAEPNLFSVLRAKPAMGRVFTDADNVAGAEVVGVLSHRAWSRYFGSDPAIIGKRVRIHVTFANHTASAMTVAGVMPPEFRYEEIDLWLPLQQFWGEIDTKRGNHWFRGIGRMKSGATLPQLRTDLDSIARDLEQQYPATNKDVRVVSESLVSYYAGQTRTPLLVLMGAVGFVLLIACSNVVHLLLVRTIGRTREIAVRLALGAGFARLAQLLAAESLVIALCGGALGVLLAHWGAAWAVAEQPGLLRRADNIRIDTTAIAYACGITLLTFAILSLTPVLHAARASRIDALHADGRGGGSVRQRRLGWSLIVAEIAMASILLSGAGLMIQTLRKMSEVDLGYRPDQVVAVNFNMPMFKLQGENLRGVSLRILEEARSVPGFASAAFAGPFDVGGNGSLPPVKIPGRTNPSTPPMVPMTTVTADFFDTLRIPLRAGRTSAPPRTDIVDMVVNEEFARRFFPGEDPIGKRIDLGQPAEIIGVVGNTRLQGGLSRTLPEMYWIDYGAWGSGTLLIRTTSPEVVAGLLRDKLRQIEPEIRVGRRRLLTGDEENRSALQRFTRSVLAVFGVLAIVLASLGIYGVASYAVAQRTREIGVRVALGATRSAIARIVAQQTLSASIAGAILGVAGASILVQFLSKQLYGVSAHDPWTYAAATALILAMVFLASAIPMLRASRIDPAVCLRQE